MRRFQCGIQEISLMTIEGGLLLLMNFTVLTAIFLYWVILKKETAFPHNHEKIYCIPGHVLFVCSLPGHASYCWRSDSRETTLWKRFLRHSSIFLLGTNSRVLSECAKFPPPCPTSTVPVLTVHVCRIHQTF